MNESTTQTDYKTAQATAHTDWSRTKIYLIVAVICLAVTGINRWWNQPSEIAEFGKVGEAFFEDFVDPTKASSLEVLAFDTENVRPVSFAVRQNENNQWVIPSHHNYPADAQEQLAQTAASIIGVQRGAMVTRWPSDHARYGVVNPKQDSLNVDQVDGVGRRLTLTGAADVVLADFIIGDAVEGTADQFYVRHPEEDEVYITTLNVDLSTKFTDWVERDLFDLNDDDVRKIEVNDYSFDELSGRLTRSEVSVIERPSAGEPWLADFVDVEKQQVNEPAVSETISTIAGLEIVGVRPKQAGLTPDLQIDTKALGSQQGLNQLQNDLLTRGFLLQPSEDGRPNQLRLIAREGELSVGTEAGLVFRMYFGRAFTGSQAEMEIGFANGAAEAEADSDDDSDSDAQTADNPEDTDESADAGEAAADAKDEEPGRYVFVTVDFDPTLLGGLLQKPLEPEKSARLIELEKQAAEAKPTGTSADGDTESDAAAKADADQNDKDQPVETESKDGAAENADEDQGQDESQDTDQSSDATDQESQAKPQMSELEKLQQAFQVAVVKYQADLEEFNGYQERVKRGKGLAEQLNSRFANWYYVISGDSYEKLSLERVSYVSQKPEPKPDATSEPPAGIDVPKFQPPAGLDVKEPPAGSRSVEKKTTDQQQTTEQQEQSSTKDQKPDKPEAVEPSEPTEKSADSDPSDQPKETGKDEAGQPPATESKEVDSEKPAAADPDADPEPPGKS